MIAIERQRARNSSFDALVKTLGRRNRYHRLLAIAYKMHIKGFPSEEIDNLIKSAERYAKGSNQFRIAWYLQKEFGS